MHKESSIHLEIKNNQDVLSLIKLITPKDFRFFEIKKQEKIYIVMCKKNSRSANVFYILLGNDKAVVMEETSLIQSEIKQNLEMDIQNTTLDFCNTDANSISDIIGLGDLYLQMFYLKTDKEKLLQLHKYFFN